MTGLAIPKSPDRAEFADDHAYLRACREEAPFVFSPMGFPVALRHHLIERLVDPRTTRQLEKETMMLQGISGGPIYKMFEFSMLFSNGKTHQLRRGPVSRTFAFKLVEAYRAEIAQLAEEMVLARRGKGPIDFLDEIAGDIPARVIARILGIPEADIPQFRYWVYSGVRGIGIHDPAIRPEIEDSLAKLQAYTTDLLTKKPDTDDFLSRYMRDAEGLDELTIEDVRIQVLTLIMAGSDTTRLAICATLLHLLKHPEQWRDLCADPEGLKSKAVAEGMRFEPSVASFPRVALEELELDGYTIPQGSVVGVSTMSAMRDEKVYRDPDRFDIHRDDHPKWHPIFGAGAHRCLGEALARIELEEVIAAIARHAPDTALSGDDPVIEGMVAVRSIDRMWVSFA